MLGNLSDFDPNTHTLESVELSELDKLALGRLSDLVARVTQAYESYSFHVVYRSLVDYVAVDLSALYLDVVKDTLYSDAPGAPGRRAVQAVLFEITSALARLAAPVLCFTAEDVWQHLPTFEGKAASVHLTDLPKGTLLADDDEAVTTWNTLRKYRDLSGKALEEFRAQKNRSEDACLTIHAPEEDRAVLRKSLQTFANLTIVSKVVLGDESDGRIEVSAAPGSRCERCWRWYEEMSETSNDLCLRCAGAMA
jgi:isoleucyl-tRNA synthetase